MLILKRKPKERCVIFNKETGELIAFVENCGLTATSIGFHTEGDIMVTRHEKYLQIIEEMEAAENG